MLFQMDEYLENTHLLPYYFFFALIHEYLNASFTLVFWTLYSPFNPIVCVVVTVIKSLFVAIFAALFASLAYVLYFDKFVGRYLKRFKVFPEFLPFLFILFSQFHLRYCILNILYTFLFNFIYRND